MVRAVTNRGKQMWLAYEGVLRAPILIEFFNRLLMTSESKAFVILDGMQWRRAASLSGWLADRGERLLAFHLPDRGGLPDVAAGPALGLPPAESGPATLPLQHKRFDIFSEQIKHLITQTSSSSAHYDVKNPKEDYRP